MVPGQKGNADIINRGRQSRGCKAKSPRSVTAISRRVSGSYVVTERRGLTIWRSESGSLHSRDQIMTRQPESRLELSKILSLAY